MSTCWKCGKVLPDGQVECEPGECGVPEETNVQSIIDALRAQGQPIDWGKVTCFADLVKIMSVWMFAVMSDGRRQREFQIRRLKRSAKFFKANPRFLL